MSYTNWHTLITVAMDGRNESWEDVVEHTLDNEDLYREFDDDIGVEQGTPFTLWTQDRVYFPICYDGSEWVGSVPRNPCDEISGHFGG